MWRWEAWSVEGRTPPKARSFGAALRSPTASCASSPSASDFFGTPELVISGGFAGTIHAGVHVGTLDLECRKVVWKPSSPLVKLHDHTLAVLRQRVFVFGGCSEGRFRQVFYKDIHELDVSGGGHRIRLSCEGTAPRPRSNHTAVVWGEKMWVFGGCKLDVAPSRLYNDLFTFDGEAWRQVHIDEGPCARSGHSCVAFKDGLLVFGGWDGTELMHDTWICDGASWAEISTTGCAPTPRACHAAAMVGSSSMLVHGGLSYFGDEEARCVQESQVYVLDTIAMSWSAVHVEGYAPAQRAFHQAFALPGNMRVLIFGGGTSTNDSGTNFNDVHELRRITWSPAHHSLFPARVKAQALWWLLLGQRLKVLPHIIWLRIASFFLEC